MWGRRAGGLCLRAGRPPGGVRVRALGGVAGSGTVLCPNQKGAPGGDYQACPACGPCPVQAHGHGGRGQGGAERDQGDLPACHPAGGDDADGSRRGDAGDPAVPSRVGVREGGRDDAGRCQQAAGDRGQDRGEAAQAAASVPRCRGRMRRRGARAYSGSAGSRIVPPRSSSSISRKFCGAIALTSGTC
jgi:hypothetical protein